MPVQNFNDWTIAMVDIEISRDFSFGIYVYIIQRLQQTPGLLKAVVSIQFVLNYTSIGLRPFGEKHDWLYCAENLVRIRVLSVLQSTHNNSSHFLEHNDVLHVLYN